MQKTSHTVEDVAAFEESSEDLIVERVQPFAADLNVVVTVNDRKIVFQIRAPEQFVNCWVKKERMAKSECSRKAHCGIGRHSRRNSAARPYLARIRKVGLV